MSFSGNFIDKSIISNDSGYCKIDTTGDTNIDGKFCFNEEQATPTAPVDGNGWLYTKSDGKIYWQSFDVAETDLTSGGSGASDKIFNSNGKCEIQTNGDTFIDTNLGIGINAPGTLLHLKKQTTTSGTPVEMLRLQAFEGSNQNLVKGDGPSINFHVAEGNPPGNVSELGGQLAVVRESDGDTDGSSAMTFWTAISDASPTEKMRITSAGLVGIGTDAPSTELHVDGYQTFYKSTELPGNNTSGSANTVNKIIMGNAFSPQINVMYPNNSFTDSTELHLKTANQNTTTDNSPSRIVIAGLNGYTTIGYGFKGTGYMLSVNGGTYSSGGFTSSDDRIKYNEQVINSSSALNLINQLSPQKYEKIIEQPAEAVGNWIPTDAEWPTVKDQYSWMDEAGLIAQDIQQIPELSWCVMGEEVDSEGNQTALRLNYNDIYAYHISATKELSSQLNEEKAKIATLETQMTEQQNTIEELLLRVSALELL